jgi:hypothetical protein
MRLAYYAVAAALLAGTSYYAFDHFGPLAGIACLMLAMLVVWSASESIRQSSYRY